MGLGREWSEVECSELALARDCAKSEYARQSCKDIEVGV